MLIHINKNSSVDCILFNMKWWYIPKATTRRLNCVQKNLSAALNIDFSALSVLHMAWFTRCMTRHVPRRLCVNESTMYFGIRIPNPSCNRKQWIRCFCCQKFRTIITKDGDSPKTMEQNLSTVNQRGQFHCHLSVHSFVSRCSVKLTISCFTSGSSNSFAFKHKNNTVVVK